MMQQRATFGAGCFWGVEAAFRKVPGVKATEVGYAGGHLEAPTYEAVCTGLTDHAEVVEVTFGEPATFRQLLDLFWTLHDPTTLNRQGPDVGTQYRSVIFTHDAAQQAEAEASMAVAQARFSRPIVTEILPSPTFWRGEEYHQCYLEKRGLGSCGGGGSWHG